MQQLDTGVVADEVTKVLDLVSVEVEEEELLERRLDEQRVERAARDEFAGALGDVDAGTGERVDVDV